jgi:hypothetical protein
MSVIVANDTVNIGDFTLRVSAVVPPATPST